MPKDQGKAPISPLCVWLLTTFTPFLLGTARTKRVQAQVKWDQPLLVKSYKVSTSQGMTPTGSHWKG